jgi:hypothetical protein
MRGLIGIGVVLVALAAVGAGTAFGDHSSSSLGGQRTVCGDSGWPSSAQGVPAALRGVTQGYFLWHDGRGWHLRLRAGSTSELVGSVSASARIRLLGITSAVRSGLKARRANGFSFRLSGTGKSEGIDFAAACAGSLAVRFGEAPASGQVPSGAAIPVGSASPTAVFLGAKDPAPAASFELIRPPTTGVEGDILVGPSGPTCPSTGCPAKHAQGTVRIETASRTRGGSSGQLVAMVPTDAQGHFRAQIPPGHYLLNVVKDEPGFPIAKPSVVDVEGGVLTQVILLLDTGIR